MAGPTDDAQVGVRAEELQSAPRSANPSSGNDNESRGTNNANNASNANGGTVSFVKSPKAYLSLRWKRFGVWQRAWRHHLHDTVIPANKLERRLQLMCLVTVVYFFASIGAIIALAVTVGRRHQE